MYNTSLVSLTGAFAFMNAALTHPTGLIESLLKHEQNHQSNAVPRLVQYVQTFHPEDDENAHLSLLPLLNHNTGITHVLLAALHINGPNGDITLNDNSPNSTYYDRTWSEVATLQDSGINVMVMMGGAATGSYDGRLCNKEDGSIQDEFYLPLVSTLKYHHLDGIDLDIEERVATLCPQNLVQRIRSDFGDDFIITMAPVASDLTGSGGSFGGFSYKEFDQTSAGSEVNWYNGQYYSGFVEGSIEESYQAAVKNGFSPERIVLGVLDNPNDGDGFVGLNDIKEIITNLKDDYDNFGGIDSWEYFDAGGADGLSQPWMWVKQIARVLFGSSSKKTISRRSRRNHTPPLPSGVAMLMSEGHGQINAAKAMRLAKGDAVVARIILAHD